MTNPKKKELPDYTILIDELESSYKYTLWEHDICLNTEMYRPGTFIMFQLDVSPKDECDTKKLAKFYEAVKRFSNEYVNLKSSYEAHGLKTGNRYKISELEIYIYDLDKGKETLSEMMRYYKVICSSVKPMITIDINRCLIDKSNFNSALDIVRIVK